MTAVGESVEVLAAQVRAVMGEAGSVKVNDHLARYRRGSKALDALVARAKETDELRRGRTRPNYRPEEYDELKAERDALVARVTEAEHERDELQAIIGHPRSLHSQLRDARNALEDIADPSCARAAWQLKLVARRVLARLDGSSE